MKDKRNLPDVHRRRPDRLLTVLAVLYFLGVVLGTVMYCTLDDCKAEMIDGVLESFVRGRMEHSFRETLADSFSGAFLLLLICFFLGYCVIAEPLEFFVPFFRGLGAGTSIAGMYSIYGISGVGASAVLIVPNAVLSAVVLIIASREAVRFSAVLFCSAFLKDPEQDRPDLRLYFTKFMILCTGLGISSLIDSVLTFAFMGFWTDMLGK